MQFTDFKASAPLERALVDLEFEAPTTIQAEAIPPAMEGSDVLGTAQTGTGKTLAYLLPALDRLLHGKQIRDPRLVVLAPTRELAIQIAGDATPPRSPHIPAHAGGLWRRPTSPADGRSAQGS